MRWIVYRRREFCMALFAAALIPLAGCGGAPAPTAAPAKEIKLEVVKYPEFAAALAAHKGKIVVLDIWAEY
jgi:hypothetical protein